MKSLRNPWHINKFPDNLLKAGFIEWKYFNFSAPAVSGIFLYLITDPLNLTGTGGGRVIGRIFTKKKIYGGVAKVPMKEVIASNKDAGIEIGIDNFIKVGGNNYNIGGKLKDIAWKLEYSPLLRPVMGFSNMKMDFLGVEKSSWEIKMPKARVSGTIKIGGRTVRIRSFGYADANWGNIVIPATSRFSWAQYNDGKSSTVFFEIQNALGMGRKRTNHWSEIFVNYGGRKIQFKESDVGVTSFNQTVIFGTKIKTPNAMTINAKNKNYNLILQIYALHSDPLELKVPFSLPMRPITVEQPSLIRIELFRKTGGLWKLVHKTSGKGFMEHAFCDIKFENIRREKGIPI
jgi:hypothetical protein